MTYTYKNLDLFFDEVFSELTCEPDTRAYIKGIFLKYKSSKDDLSKESITIIFSNAKQNLDFHTFQSLGDWIFFTKSFAPEHLHAASEDYYNYIGRVSYYKCYLLINRKWRLFEELSDNFDSLESQARTLLRKNCYPSF